VALAGSGADGDGRIATAPDGMSNRAIRYPVWVVPPVHESPADPLRRSRLRPPRLGVRVREGVSVGVPVGVGLLVRVGVLVLVLVGVRVGFCTDGSHVFGNTDTVAELELMVARSGRPSPLKSPATRTCAPSATEK
jgi:hypothetical protein